MKKNIIGKDPMCFMKDNECYKYIIPENYVKYKNVEECKLLTNHYIY